MKMLIRAGFSLIEVLVSMFILSLLLLSLDATEIFALRQSHAAYFFSLATQQMNGIVERLRTLGSAEGLTEQLSIWNKQNQMILPLGKGQVIGNFPIYAIKLTWKVDGQEEYLQEQINL